MTPSTPRCKSNTLQGRLRGTCGSTSFPSPVVQFKVVVVSIPWIVSRKSFSGAKTIEHTISTASEGVMTGNAESSLSTQWKMIRVKQDILKDILKVTKETTLTCGRHQGNHSCRPPPDLLNIFGPRAKLLMTVPPSFPKTLDPPLIEHWYVIKEILPELHELDIEAWMINDTKVQAPDRAPDDVPSDVVTMDTSKLSGQPYSRDAHKLTDMAIYIFTSGTTGMPKPVNVLHRKIIRATYLHFFSDLTPEDVYYIALPLYHSAALLQGVFSLWYYGGTVALAKKFSASRFWADIRKHRATGFHYIGELCRYLLAQPEKPDDGMYPRKIRISQGNGLRPEIWREFQDRFKIGKIFEVYASTEGNFGFINIDGKIGTVGRYPWFMKNAIDTLEIVDYDYASGEPKRGPNGLCIQLPAGETGLALNKINKDNPFTGYKGSEEKTLQKIVSNVKKRGDLYFNTGDLLMLDEDGYVYFKDRLGDTFRWKGENVSTMEVSQALSTFPVILEANVYGVKIPGQDGRAGMAAVVIREGHKLDCQAFFRHVTDCLPDYACPKFIRVMDEMEITGTFKHKKTKLVEQGFNVEVIEDIMYVVDAKEQTYAPMTSEHVKKIHDGALKF